MNTDALNQSERQAKQMQPVPTAKPGFDYDPP